MKVNFIIKKVDSKLIERKRQDTLEICRIFNEENKRGLNAEENLSYRNKRSVNNNELGNTNLKQEDLVRVEKIVDKLYDDLDSTTVAYRRRVLIDVSKEKVIFIDIDEAKESVKESLTKWHGT